MKTILGTWFPRVMRRVVHRAIISGERKCSMEPGGDRRLIGLRIECLEGRWPLTLALASAGFSSVASFPIPMDSLSAYEAPESPDAVAAAASESLVQVESGQQEAGSGTPWLVRQAPPLGAPTNTVVRVKTEAELQEAVANLQSDTTIMIEPGEYVLTRDLFLPRGVNNVTIRGATENRDDVVLKGGGMHEVVPGRAQIGIHVRGSDQLTIANLTIRDMWHHAIQVHGEQEPTATRIYNVHLVDIRTQFIKGSTNHESGAKNGIVEYSLIEYTTTSTGTYTNGVDILHAENWTIRDNVFRNIRGPENGGLAGPAILAWQGSRNTLVERNVLLNCQYGIALGLRANKADDHSGGIVRNNFVYRGVGQSGDVGIVINHDPEASVLHNTVILSGTYPNAIEYRFPETRAVIANNLTDGNIQRRDGAQAELVGNITNAQPSWFKDPAGGDLHLVPGVPAIDAAVAEFTTAVDFDGEDRPLGSAQDVGADELPDGQLPEPTIPGDLDGDSDVDSVDLNFMILNWTGVLEGGDRTAEQGDLDGDGDVDSADLSRLLLSWTGVV